MEKDLTDKAFYNDIRDILQKARTQAYTAVNTAMVNAYWAIGKRNGKRLLGYWKTHC